MNHKENMTTDTVRFFIYRDCIAATSDIENGTFLNEVKFRKNKECGIIVALKNVLMPKEVKDAILARYECDNSVAKISIYCNQESEEKIKSLFLLGFGNHLIATDGFNVIIDENTDLKLLDEVPECDNVVPPEFMTYINS